MLSKSCFLVIIATVLSIGVNAQETPDFRLVKNRGAQAEKAFVHNRNGYNYFLFELDKSHFVTERSSLTQEELLLVEPAAKYVNAENQVLTLEDAQSPVFNFYDYGIRLQRDKRTFIALDDQHVLVFFSNPELTQLFVNSDFNVK